MIELKFILNLLRKIFLIVILFTLVACNIVVNNGELTLGKKIENEYTSLVNGTTTTHTNWEFSGEVVDMTATSYNETYKTYDVNIILNVDGVYIGIFNGLVNGVYPKEIPNLSVGTVVDVKGTIDEKYPLTSGSLTAKISFTNPEISWDGVKEEVKPDDKTEPNDKPDDKTEPSDKPEDKTEPVAGSTYTGNVNFAMINDTHGAFDDSNDGYSILRVDSLLDNLETEKGDYIKIANGDILQGSYVSSTLYGLPLIEALNAMDFDVFVLGNHEFDWGLQYIAAYKDGDPTNGEADFPFLGANIYYADTQTRPDWIDPYKIVEYENDGQTVRVGIIGVIGGKQESSILTENVSDYTFLDDPSKLIGEYAYELRVEKGCDVVVVSSHDYDETLNSKISSYEGDRAIDAIFCGHTHELVSENVTRIDGFSIPVVQNLHKKNTLQSLTVSLNSGDVINAKTQVYYPKNYAMSSDLADVYDKYAFVIQEAERVLGNSGYLSRETLGLYAVEAMLDYNYNIDGYDTVSLSIINTGGVRAYISGGTITVNDVFNSFPFNNEVYLVNISGWYLSRLVNDSYFYVDGLSNFDSTKNYTIAVIDYVFMKPYYYNNIFKYADSVYETNVLMRDLVVDYIDNKY